MNLELKEHLELKVKENVLVIPPALQLVIQEIINTQKELKKIRKGLKDIDDRLASNQS